MAIRSLIIWLHGLGDSGEANEPIVKNYFTSPDFNNTRWSFPTAPFSTVTCNSSLAVASVLLYPKTLGGCAVLSGWIPFSSSSFTRRITPEATKTPILWIHGRVDTSVLFSAGEAGLAFLRKAGMISCEFKEYPNLGHSLCDEEMQYLQSWVSERLKGESLLIVDEKEKQHESKKNQEKSTTCCLCSIFSWDKWM